MKRILSTLLTAAMLLSLVIVAAVPAAAAKGEWDTYEEAGQADTSSTYSEGDLRSIGGYEYTNEGLRVTPADWKTSAPYTLVQRTTTVDLKEGVYMLVRVDEFSYDANDRWFNISIWDSVRLHPGEGNTAYGEGVQTLVRPSKTESQDIPGDIKTVSWHIETWKSGGSATTMAEESVKATEDGKPLMALTVEWDETNKTYVVDINGAEAPPETIAWMNERFGGNDSQAYIGFAMHSTKLGGTAGCTILKFGIDEATATTPWAEGDTKKPTNYDNSKADIADASNVPEGQPAVLLNGNKAESATKTFHSANGAQLSTGEGNTIHAVATNSTADIIVDVNNKISYDIKDFPVIVALTKNYCTCGLDGECIAIESVMYRVMNGDIIGADDVYKVNDVEIINYEPYVIGDDTYLGFICDVTDTDYVSFETSGRINGMRFDAQGIDTSTAGANAYDMCFIAYFRNHDEAIAYVENYLQGLGWTPDVEAEETEESENETTVTAGENEETTTVAGGEQATEKQPEATEAQGGNTEEKGGCGAVVSFGAIAVVATVAGCGMIAFKKKED